MNKALISWTLPLFISLLIVVFIRIFYVHFQVVNDDGMKNTLKKGDLIVCSAAKKIAKNDIVLVTWGKSLEPQFKRIIAFPGDTLLIQRSIIYINNQRFNDDSKVLFTYSFSSDSIAYVRSLLNRCKLSYDSSLASIGVFKFDAGLQELKMIKATSMKFDVKRVVGDPSVAENKTKILHSSVYWNKDNLGPIIIPAKGLKLKINEKVFMLYKEIIESESGKKAEFVDNKVYMSKFPLDFYTFKNDYYFLLNDKRNDETDSRTKGFVSREMIISKLWFKLPW